MTSSQKVEHRSVALKTLLNDYTDENYGIYREKCKIAKRHLQKTKKSKFRTFCNELNPCMKIDDVWRYIKSFKKRKLTTNSQDNNYAKDPKIIEAIDKIAPIQQNPKIEIKRNNNKNEILDMEIKLQEVISAINKLKVQSAPGQDMITYRIIKQLPIKAVKILTKIYNLIIDTEIIPKTWTQQFVCLIPKPNNKGYRPIVLSSCMQKILERIENDRVQWFLENKNFFPKQFFGFRRSKSCNSSLAIFA